ncbi:MAG: T9SS type A sorting domain-containing protein [Saprospiraceae bacterium]|nr:T9SS type A sorting domain-containing protein [Saprospiraceae bacterium]
MSHYKIFIALLFTSHFAFCQNISFVDLNFKNHLLQKICVDTDLNGTWDAKGDQNADGEISLAEAEAIQSLLLNVQDIKDISDLKYFTNLKRLYGIALNYIEKPFDLKDNSKLEILELALNTSKFSMKSFSKLSSCIFALGQNVNNIYINDNPLLQKIEFKSKFSEPVNNLDSLDLGNNNLTSLKIKFDWKKKNYKYLNCKNNKLSTIEFESYQSFDEINLSNNQLTDQSIANVFIYGTKMFLQNNLIQNLSIVTSTIPVNYLTFVGNPLKTFNFQSSVNSILERLDFTGLIMLESIDINSSGKINEIILQDLSSIKSLNVACEEIAKDLIIKELKTLNSTRINIKGNIYLQNISQFNNANFYITTSKELHFTDNFISNLKIMSNVQCRELYVENSGMLSDLYFGPGNGSSVKIYVKNNPLLLKLLINGSIERLDLNIQGCKMLSSVKVSYANTLTFSYGGIDVLKNLTLGFLRGEIDISNLPSLKYTNLPINPTIKLFIHSLNNLDTLILNGLAPGDVDLYNLPSLKHLDIGLLYNGNNLSCNNVSGAGHLKISNFPLLDELTINTLCVRDLEISNLPSLKNLSIKYVNLQDDNNLLAIYNLNSLKQLDLFRAHFASALFQNLPNLELLTAKYVTIRKEINLSKLENLKSIDFQWVYAKNIKAQYLPNLSKMYINVSYSENLSFVDLPNLSKIFCNLDSYPSSIKKHSLFKKLPSLTRVDFLTRNYTLDSLDFSECPNLDSIQLDFSGSLKHLNLKNNNEKISYLQPRGFQSTYNTICVDTDVEKTKIQSLISPFSNAVYEYDCVAELTHSTISGNIYIVDENNNIKLLKDQYLPLRIKDKTMEYQTLTNGEGRYRFSTPNINTDIIISPQFNTENFEFISGDTIINLSAHGDRDTINFYLKLKSSYNDAKCALIPISRPRPGERVQYTLLIKNIGPALTTANVKLYFDSTQMKISYGNSVNLLESNDFIELKGLLLPPFSAVKYHVFFDLNKPSDPNPLNSGDNLYFNVNVTPVDFDLDMSNNTYELNQKVINSFDPNQITCAQGNIVYNNDKIKPLKYFIEFENTGNAEAIFVNIINSIDTTFLDVKRFKLIDASHIVNATIVGNMVKFNFSNINLSHLKGYNTGYIYYEIMPKKELFVGDIIYNQAEIIFDYNVPILTNVHSLKMVNSSLVNDHNQIQTFTIFPNPTDSRINITLNGKNADMVEIYNYFGLLVGRISFQNEIDLSGYKKGLYIIRLLNQNIPLGSAKVVLNK